MMDVLSTIQSCVIFKILIILIIGDIVFGILRSIKEKRFTSGIGINGIIRKTAMIACMVMVYLFDKIAHFDLTAFMPENIAGFFPVVGLCEFFGFILALYESESIIDNIKALGLPFPYVVSNKINQWLNKITKGDKQ